MMEWISVKDRLPDDPFEVLVLLDNSIIKITKYFPRGWEKMPRELITDNPRWDIPQEWKEVTHWMPLPKLPEKTSKGGWICGSCIELQHTGNFANLKEDCQKCGAKKVFCYWAN